MPQSNSATGASIKRIAFAKENIELILMSAIAIMRLSIEHEFM